MAIGPIAHYHENNTYFSSVAPPPNPQVDARLPHITIQMPVYKEGLESVLMPSVESLKAAMKTYARQGGTSSIFICDDGLRLLPMAERDARLRWYREMGVGWVARPRHGCPAEGATSDDLEKGLTAKKGKKGKVETFSRAGRFKKASNMNYALKLSLCMEKCLEILVREKGAGSLRASGVPSYPGATPTLAQLASREQQELEESLSSNSHHRYPPTSPNLSSMQGRGFGYGMQYLGREGDDMTVGAGVGPTDPLSNPLAMGTPTPGTPVIPGTPVTAAPGAPLLPSQGVDEQGIISSLETLTDDLEERALQMAIEEVYEVTGRKWKPWAAGAKAMRMGEIVLLVDSDTVVPEDCLRDAAREMAQDQNVAIIQHESDVMQVAHHYFENGIAYFTRRINKCISMACANGEVAPFVGHNAFLRWRALQDVVYPDGCIWSESNVSEDFDMALRLMKKGWVIRWATYSKGGFKEGVSLTVDDELNRWMKYAYGCNELLFNPLVEWWRKGPIAPQIHRFMWSNAPLHYKISMMAYMFSYYGIAAALPISLLNYVLLGFELPVDGFYMHSFEIWLATTVVFFGSGNVGYTILGYRLGERGLFEGLLENLMWIPFFFFFFGGLSIPVSQSILAHVFSYNITWSATIKEVERSNFFKEIPKIAKRFWFPLLTSIVILIGIVILSTPLVPIGFRVDGSSWAVIFPLSVICACHILFPIVLNPWLMVFSY
ncbi:glycosyltransferase family 2 protein [Moniliophthora roreri MCA 2997]|uniref:Glycosyltransferase family 2 protein n=1 Tax=Moniliophthora roreri (strain MCA 2997) TaxID=1381753 RepID=V2WRQ0_MONRO|nr:glycosyltransferase family 2 protein [Moniliophthora roreri MCA 2997]